MYDINIEQTFLEKVATAIKVLFIISGLLNIFAGFPVIFQYHSDFIGGLSIIINGIILIIIGYILCSLIRVYVTNSRNLSKIEENTKTIKY